MKVGVFDINGNVKGEIELPRIFETPYRPDVIKRAVLALQSMGRQAYGTDPRAGKRTSAHYHSRRKYRFTMMNKELSRIPRIHGKIGYMALRARFAPHAVKGRRAHPPKADKKWEQLVNKKEGMLAIKSALAATACKELVDAHGYKAPATLPIIFDNTFQDLEKTKQIKAVLEKIGLQDEIKRAARTKVRAGRGKMRGRRYNRKKSLLIVTSENAKLLKSARNLNGVDVATTKDLTVEMLAPGAQAGRLAAFTESALEELQKRFGE